MKSKGFTLIETLITIGIFVMAIGAISSFIYMSYKTNAFALQQSNAIDEARRGIKTMVREIREADMGDDGSYIIEKAEDYEIIFYSDIDQDGDTEKIRYFIYDSGSLDDDCVVYSSGGSCSVSFSSFSAGTIDSAQVEVCVEGDLNGGNETVAISADGTALGTLCQAGCSQCSGSWEGCTTYDVTAQAQDGSISFMADGSAAVGGWSGGFCDWQQSNHSLKASFVFSWTEAASGASVSLKKGVTNPTGYPLAYPDDQEEVTVISSYVRNVLPLLRYYDGQGDELLAPARLDDTRLIKVYIVVNIDPNRPPDNFELESQVQIRNLKNNL